MKLWLLCFTCLWIQVQCLTVKAQDSPEAAAVVGGAVTAGQRQLLIDVYYRAGNPDDEAWLKRAREYATQNPGLKVVPRDVAGNPDLEKSLKAIQAALKLPATAVPLVYGLNRGIHQAKDDADFSAQMDRLRVVEMYCKPNCPHCDQAEQHLKKVLPLFPGLVFEKRNITTDSQANSDLQALLRQRNTNSQTVPVLHLANQLLIGFDIKQKSGDKVDELLTRWSWAAK
ncbi:MAG: glutaredoxin family protein [Planctomycetaceae bacterium]|nr:glutaredoxin family protein [Planctomycetaceae bacterium]